MKVIQSFSDPGHGWSKVKRSELIKLDILNKITSCSYQRGEYVYLEEDCDLTTYVNALKSTGIEYKFTKNYTKGHRRSKIRNYERFSI